MKSPHRKPAILSRKGGELSVSSPGLVDLLRAVLDRGAQFRFKARGFSMSPFVKDGDVVTVSPLPKAVPRLGDVVAFVHPQTKRLVIHRVVRKMGDSYLMRGDNALAADGLIPKSCILGRVTRLERGNRRVYLGLGPERLLIALVSPRGPLSSLLLPVWRLVRPLFKRSLYDRKLGI